MSKIIQDPYGGREPWEIWNPRFTGEVGGLEQIGASGAKLDIVWNFVRDALEITEIGNRFQGNRIIELGAGESQLFRNYVTKKGAGEYAGVDLYVRSDLVEQVIGSTRVRMFGEDAYRFLLGQPSNSATIAEFMFLCGEIFAKQCERLGIDPRAIANALAREIHRVQKPGAHFISMSGDELFLEALERVGFIRESFEIFFRKD